MMPKFRVDVLAHGETHWASNGVRFDTQPEALEYAHRLYDRWTMVFKMRTVPETQPEREEYVPGSEHKDWA